MSTIRKVLAPLTPLAAVLSVGCRPAPGPAPAPADRGGFVVTLGNDTVSAESFVRTGNRVEGMIARRIPRTTILRYTMTVGADGLPDRVEYTTRLPDGSLPQNGARGVVVTFAGDSVVTAIQRDTLVTRRVSAPAAFPELDGSVAYYAFPIAALRSTGRDSAMFLAYLPGAGGGDETPVARAGANVYRAWYFGFPMMVTVDDAGRMLAIDGSRTTFRIQARRQADVDVQAIAERFLARERAQGAMTALSPTDSTMASIGGANIKVRYGRPSARGRRIWGPSGVLGDTLWRTGANASTRLMTDQPLRFGDRTIPAGTHVIQTLAVPGRYALVLRLASGEELRIPLQSSQLATPVERFTIAIPSAGERAGTLRLQWDTLELWAPFTIASP